MCDPFLTFVCDLFASNLAGMHWISYAERLSPCTQTLAKVYSTSEWCYWNILLAGLCNRGVLVSTLAFETLGWGFESSVGFSTSHYSWRKLCIVHHLTSPFGTDLWIGKLSVKWNSLSNDCFERTNAGSRALMVLDYSRCVVLGSGPA